MNQTFAAFAFSMGRVCRLLCYFSTHTNRGQKDDDYEWERARWNR